jgi:CHAT domain-containing protein
LHYLPFAVLPVPGRDAVPLIAEHEVTTIPSASSLAALRRLLGSRPPAPRAVAVFADPVFEASDRRLAAPAPGKIPAGSQLANAILTGRGLDDRELPRLPFSRGEAESILSLLPPGEGLALLDFDASLGAGVAGRLSQYRILHFATHGVLDTSRPELSGLVLSLVDRQGQPREGFLHAAEIADLDLAADLVVLSACETALGKEIRGEGVVGLTRSFMAAGAERVLVSLWRVEDRATAELMRRFYQALLAEGASPAAALRQAQMALRETPAWSAPYFWAGFVLQGDWR